jgi:hypothetical protein
VSGYAASARLQGSAPQFAFTGDHVHRSLAPGGAAAVSGAENTSVIDQFELVGRPIDEMIGEWLASVGESFSQLTFFVFDPESWR